MIKLRIQYSPAPPPLICHNVHCESDFDSFDEVMVLGGMFRNRGKWALLCGDCAKLFWKEEARKERDHDDWIARGCP